MSAVAEEKRYTPADLLRLKDGDRYELVNGQLVEHAMSMLSSYVAGEVAGRLREFARANARGWVLPEGTSYQCFPDAPEKVRRADVSFIEGRRISWEEASAEGHLAIAPDLAVEVVSPNDLAYEVESKVGDYRKAGVRLIWVIYPEARTVRVERLQGKGTVLHEDDELDGEDVLPGFRCRVGDLYLPPPGVAPRRQGAAL